MPPRAHEVTRLEGFSDAVLGFALTLLVVSLEVPETFEELMAQVEGFVGFALMFAMVCWIWYEHNKFFRRYGLQDAWTVFLNCVLLFVVLFYVYPLKFLTGALLKGFFGLGDANTPSIQDGEAAASTVMLLYSTGVVAIFGTLVLLYQHAWRRRAELGLSRLDELTLTFNKRGHIISASIGVASILLTLTMPHLSFIAGVIYMLMGPLHTWNGFQAGKAVEREQRAAPDASPTGGP